MKAVIVVGPFPHYNTARFCNHVLCARPSGLCFTATASSRHPRRRHCHYADFMGGKREAGESKSLSKGTQSKQGGDLSSGLTPKPVLLTTSPNYSQRKRESLPKPLSHSWTPLQRTRCKGSKQPSPCAILKRDRVLSPPDPYKARVGRGREGKGRFSAEKESDEGPEPTSETDLNLKGAGTSFQNESSTNPRNRN